MKEYLKQLLIRSFDDKLSQKEQDELQKGFAKFPELGQEKEALSFVRNALQKQSYSFNYGFSEKVMRKIEESQYLSGQNLHDYFTTQLNKLFLRWLMPVGTVAIAILVIALYFTENSATVNVSNLSFSDAFTLSVYNLK